MVLDITINELSGGSWAFKSRQSDAWTLCLDSQMGCSGLKVHVPDSTRLLPDVI